KSMAASGAASSGPIKARRSPSPAPLTGLRGCMVKLCGRPSMAAATLSFPTLALAALSFTTFAFAALALATGAFVLALVEGFDFLAGDAAVAVGVDLRKLF